MWKELLQKVLKNFKAGLYLLKDAHETFGIKMHDRIVA